MNAEFRTPKYFITRYSKFGVRYYLAGDRYELMCICPNIGCCGGIYGGSILSVNDNRLAKRKI
jgi:hypothetical protein